MRGLVLGVTLVLASGTAHAAAPDPRACPPLKPQDTSERQRTKPLPVPTSVAVVMRSNLDRYAVSTLSGGIVCIDTREMEDTQEDHALSADQRFLSFTWSGYETGGFVVVDRSGKGQVVETGAAPKFSPAGKWMAAVEWSESGFGTLNGFAVWQIFPEGLKEVVRLEDIPAMADWRIDYWNGESCVYLSAISMDKVPDDPREIGSVPRTRFIARELWMRAGGSTWKLEPATKDCAFR